MSLYYLYFICLLLPLFLYWVLPERFSPYPLMATTVVFLLIMSPHSLLLLTFTSLSTFLISRKITHSNHLLLLVIGQALVLFIFFKSGISGSSVLWARRIIPIGFSYYSFRQIHYAIEAYKNKLPRHTLIDFLNYMFFLPTFLIGPINRFPSFLVDIKRKRWNNEMFSRGLERLLYGGVKINFLGNYVFSFYSDRLINALEYEWLASYLSMVQFSANAYFQFSGYSDLAIGVSLLFGIRITENFNYPFLAKNISDFWNRWHISLSEWCRDYVFLPLFSFSRNALFAVGCSMLTLAFWHEFSLRYVLWGLSHALAIQFFNYYKTSGLSGKLSEFPRLRALSGNFITLHFVMLSFLLIKEPDLAESFREIAKILCISF